ncbi:MAG: insulinase family protein [Gemmatimonadetes bacterium]|nr:insulinase family protein [Gemmatimonadota bacterium]NNM04306.1 insulinase family protein [Gemmatimonadota bacterium]
MTGRDVSPLDRSRPPEAGSVRSFEFPPILPSDLPNGLQVRIARMTRAPLVTMSVVMDAGEAVLPDRSAGLAVLAGEALEGGSENLSGLELADALEGIGSGLSVRTGWDATTVSLTCLADRMEEGMSLLSEALLRSTFPAEEIDRLRSQRLAAIRQRQMDPGSLADDSAAHFVYADSVPYHRPLGGKTESLETLDREDARSFALDRFTPSGAGFVIVGDVEVSEARTLIGGHFGEWAGKGTRAGDVSAEPRFGERRVMVVDRPGAVQSEVRIGQIGVPRKTPFFFPLRVFNAVLGGAFTSRLMLNLREKQGFTYGVRSRFSHRRGPGPFRISMAVATEVTAPAVREALTELEGILETGPTEVEVERARDYIAGVFPLALETTGQVAARISEIQVYDLPLDFFSTYRDRIREVTPSSAHEAGRATIRPDQLAVVVVGDAEGVVGPLEELGIGPVEVVSDH